jgi:hypothetical protein
VTRFGFSGESARPQPCRCQPRIDPVRGICMTTAARVIAQGRASSNCSVSFIDRRVGQRESKGPCFRECSIVLLMTVRRLEIFIAPSFFLSMGFIVDDMESASLSRS